MWTSLGLFPFIGMLAQSPGAEKASCSVYECAYECTEAFYWAERRPADPLALIEKRRDTAVTLREGEQLNHKECLWEWRQCAWEKMEEAGDQGSNVLKVKTGWNDTFDKLFKYWSLLMERI